ncbi:MAG: hypothetical protein ACRDK3_07030 [Actinomycetota bacterium]
MPVLSDPTVVEETSPADITLDDGHGDGAVGAGISTEAEEAPVNGLMAEERLEERGDLQIEAPGAPQVPIPAPFPPPIFLRKRAVRGRYRSPGIGWQLELRIDVDGSKPLKKVSGDFFSTTGATTSYFGSFIVKNPTVTTTASEVKIEGLGTFTWAASAPFIRVTIPRVTILQSPKPATLQFITPPSTPGASYLCPFSSPYFRTIQFEQDSVAGAVPFISYNTGSLPQPPGSPVKTLTVPQAFADGGIELQLAGTPNVIPVSAAGSDTKWNDSELHAAMVNHFSLFANVPQWKVWLLVATTHVGGYRGIMFDYSDSNQRQGAAVFYDAIKGSDAASQRAQLRTYVHELGHAFNLLHSWQKNLADPPAPLGSNGGLGDLSWMNYAWKYQPPAPAPGGEAAYWAAFPFQFTNNELIHLRHGFYKNVIMGAHAFGKGAADIDPEMFDEPMVDNSGLALELRAKDTFEFGEPVVIELKLSATDLRGRQTHGFLHPNDDFVSVAIREPSGRTRAFQPMMRHCADEEKTIQLDPAQPAIYDSAYIGFGKDGFYFDQPGEYLLRAQYIATDGSRVMAPVVRLRVRPPASQADERVGELLLGEQQGQLLTLLGSESEALASGNEALDTLLEEHGEHPLSVYARLVKGVNAERDFKYLTVDKRLHVKEARPQESIDLLSDVEQASAGDEGVDNITLNLAMRRHARAEAKAGNLEQASDVMDRMVTIFEGKGLNPQVLQRVRQQAEATKAAIAAETDGGSSDDEE